MTQQFLQGVQVTSHLQIARHKALAQERGSHWLPRDASTIPEPILARIFFSTQFTRYLDRSGYIRFRRWRFYAEAGNRVVGYSSFHPNGRVSYPWCLPDHEPAAEPLLDRVLDAMRSRRMPRAFAASRRCFA